MVSFTVRSKLKDIKSLFIILPTDSSEYPISSLTSSASSFSKAINTFSLSSSSSSSIMSAISSFGIFSKSSAVLEWESPFIILLCTSGSISSKVSAAKSSSKLSKTFFSVYGIKFFKYILLSQLDVIFEAFYME